MPSHALPFDLDAELDRQAGVLLGLGYPALAGRPPDALARDVEGLRPLVHAHARAEPPTSSWVPFVVVVGRPLVTPEQTVPLTRLSGSDRPGQVDRHHGPEGLAVYRPVPPVEVPGGGVHLVLDVERGEEHCSVAPRDALPLVRARGRTPLTVDEGVALLTLHPQVLEKNRCFVLAGSRRGDRRVPALWISQRAPKLGWCWDGNPHTWLGLASAGDRAA